MWRTCGLPSVLITVTPFGFACTTTSAPDGVVACIKVIRLRRLAGYSFLDIVSPCTDRTRFRPPSPRSRAVAYVELARSLPVRPAPPAIYDRRAALRPVHPHAK